MTTSCAPTLKPVPDRRQNPRIDGMIVTEPAPLDDSDLADTTTSTQPAPQPARRTCAELGVCQNRFDCQCPTPPEAGNVWFEGPEPPEPMGAVAALVLGMLMALSLATAAWFVVGMVDFAVDWFMPGVAP